MVYGFNEDKSTFDIENKLIWYGTCSTAADTAAKVVSCSGFKLTTGATIAVKFTNAQTFTSTITLNVNDTGAKTVYGIARSTTSTIRLDGAWEANETKIFVYDGTYWRLVDQNIITSSELSSLESELGISATTSLSRLYDILMALVGTSETLATGATLYRNGKKRKLVFSGYTKTSNTFSLPSGDAPSASVNGVGLRTNSSGLATALGQIVVGTNGVVNFYYAGTYNAVGSGLSNLATGDKISAVCEWVVG